MVRALVLIESLRVSSTSLNSSVLAMLSIEVHNQRQLPVKKERKYVYSRSLYFAQTHKHTDTQTHRYTDALIHRLTDTRTQTKKIKIVSMLWEISIYIHTMFFLLCHIFLWRTKYNKQQQQQLSFLLQSIIHQTRTDYC